MQVLIDYLTMSSKIHSIDYFIFALGMSEVQMIDMIGRYGWECRKYYMGVSFLYGGRDDVCIELSGTGCRTIEEFNPSWDWLEFLRDYELDIRIGDVNISRLDIAGDDREGILYHDLLVDHCKSRRYICKARFCIWIDGDEQEVLFGSPASDRRLRIYNKSLEQELAGEHWMRCEMQMRNKNAVSFVLNWFVIGSVGKTYAMVLRDFLRFTEDLPDGFHYDRCEVCNWWTVFIGTVEQCQQLYIVGGDYTFDKVKSFIERQCASSLKLFLQVNNGDLFDLMDIVDHARLNSRQLQLLDRIREQGVE